MEISILIGGKAGFGIDKAGAIIANILNQLHYRIYIYRDYPSLIRGGHTFSIIRASPKRIQTHQSKVDFLLALNQDTLNLHKVRLKPNSVVIHDPQTVKVEGLSDSIKIIGIPIARILREESASEIMLNSCMIGGLCKTIGVGWEVLEQVFKKDIAKELDSNLKVARRAFDEVNALIKIEPLAQGKLPILSGNEALSLGLLGAGLESYVAYPMTPSSSILHFMANMAQDFGLKVIHPESEIAVMLMALGFAYAGQKVAVGTSGGGFCLMAEGLSFAGMSELPITIVVGQRPGPSTGLPTYSGQSELHFVIHAGQGEFTRLVVAPGDAEQAYYWSAVALNLAWKYQIPFIILTDKTLAEGTFSFDVGLAGEIKEEIFPVWDKKGTYKRYLVTENGVSPLAFAPEKDALIKVNSYEHDEYGITTEDPETTKIMQAKRLRKEEYLAEELEKYGVVKIHGKNDASSAILCWGSNKGVCSEVADNLGLKVIQPVVLWPLPVKEILEAIKGVKRLICVENNATGQLADLVSAHGIKTSAGIFRYDGRPFAVDELEEKVRNVLK